MSVDPQRVWATLRPEVVAGDRNAHENMVAEIIHGELSLSSRPRPKHSVVGSALGGEC